MDEVQAIITLRSGKEIEQPVSKPMGKTREQEEGEPEHIIIKEDSMNGGMPPPPPNSPSQIVATPKISTVCPSSSIDLLRNSSDLIMSLRIRLRFNVFESN